MGLYVSGLIRGRKKTLVKSVGLYAGRLIRGWAYTRVGLYAGGLIYRILRYMTSMFPILLIYLIITEFLFMIINCNSA